MESSSSSSEEVIFEQRRLRFKNFIEDSIEDESSTDARIGTYHKDSLLDMFIQYILKLSIFAGCIKT